MTPRTDNEHMGLAAPEEYDDAPHVQSVSARVTDDVSGEVVIVYRKISSRFPTGATVVYTGRCSAGEMTWSVDGTVAKRYQPRI